MIRTLGWAAAGLAAFGLLVASNTTVVRDSNDVNVYERIGSLASDPGEGFESEYPPLTSATFAALGQMDAVSFDTAWMWFLGLAILLTTLYGLFLLRDRMSAGFPLAASAAVLLLGPTVTLARFDILLACLLFLAWRAHATGKHGHSGALLALATAVKLVPLLLLPLFALTLPRGRHGRFWTGYVGGGVLSFALPILLLGVPNVWENIQFLLEYHSSRGIQVESTWAGVLMAARMLRGATVDISFDHGAHHLAGIPAGMTLFASIAALVGVVALAVRARSQKAHSAFDAHFFASIAWMLATSSILSTQYLVWIVPLALLWIVVLSRKPGADPVLLWTLGIAIGAISLLTQWVYPHGYNALLEQKTWTPVLLLNLRNALLLFLVWISLQPKAWSTWFRRLAHRVSRTRAAGPRHSLAKDLSIFALIIVVIVGGRILLRPTTSDVTYRFGEDAPVAADLPLNIPGDTERWMTIEATLHLNTLHANVLRVTPDDCLEQLVVNGQEILDGLPFCDPANGKVFRLKGILRSGNNDVIAVVRDTGGMAGVRINADQSDPLMLFLNTLTVAVLLAGGWFLINRQTRNPYAQALGLMLLGGTILRLFYVLNTPYATRAYDWDGHIEYIVYVLQHWMIPPAADGWEFHQAPLYYYLSAGIAKLLSLLHGSTEYAIRFDLPIVSLLFSIAALALGLAMGKMLFPLKKKPGSLLLFGALVATFPGLVFFASRISNDALYHALAFAFFASLLLWWRSGKISHWYLTCVLFALTFITKVSAVLMLPPMLLCFVLQRNLPWKQKLKHGLLSLLLLGALTAWLPVLRLVLEESTGKVTSFGHDAINPGLLMPTRLRDFLTFNPFQVLAIPYNNTWADESRRMFFWEFFFRSAFFGEFSMGDSLKMLSAAILLLGMGAGILMGIGLLADLRRRAYESLPMWTMLGVLVAGNLALRYRYHCSCDQDFRFAILAIIPILYFAVRGAETLPAKFRPIAKGLLALLAVLSAILLVLVPFAS